MDEVADLVEDELANGRTIEELGMASIKPNDTQTGQANDVYIG